MHTAVGAGDETRTITRSRSVRTGNATTATTGTDSGGCGTKIDPCRSISQAINNGAAGDSISVGPGLYGDLDNDGVLSGTGGEEPTSLFAAVRAA